MTEHDEHDAEQRPSRVPDPELEAGVRRLLQGTSKSDPAPPDVLRGVQRKLRERSRGKFYADGWSTAKHPPVATYLVTSAIMLGITLAIYALLSPLVGEPEAVKNEPAPVRVLPPPAAPSAR